MNDDLISLNPFKLVLIITYDDFKDVGQGLTSIIILLSSQFGDFQQFGVMKSICVSYSW
jgi:hypothetical protein